MAADVVSCMEINKTRNIVKITWEDGHISRFHSIWLRFNCRCKECKKMVVGQEPTVKRYLFPDQLYIEKAEVDKEKGGINFWMEGEVVIDHVTFLDADWLRKMCYCDECHQKMISAGKLTFHDTSVIPRINYKELDTEEGQFKFMKQVFDVGFSVISNVPCEEGTVLKVGESFAPIIDSTYGRMFNVEDSKAFSENFALSTKGLPLHTDQCHYEAGPGIQLLHAMEFDECIDGGDSQIVDMFRVMEIFRKESPEEFKVLCRVPCIFTTIDYERRSPAHLITRKPIIEVDYDDEIVAFSWNPGTEDTVRIHEKDVEVFFKAYKKLQKVTERKELMFQFRLHKGDLLLFNNRRVVHARAAYTKNGGRRRLQGTYISSEELRSKYVLLARKLGHDIPVPKIGNRSAI